MLVLALCLVVVVVFKTLLLLVPSAYNPFFHPVGEIVIS